MTPEYEQGIAANLERAGQSIQAAKDLALKGYHDFAASLWPSGSGMKMALPASSH